MAGVERSPQVALAEKIERAAHDLADAGATVPRPSDTYAVLGALMRAQETLTQVYEQYARWHANVELGVHHSGDAESELPENPSWSQASTALREAAKRSDAAATAVRRAHTANGVASWYDEIRDGS